MKEISYVALLNYHAQNFWHKSIQRSGVRGLRHIFEINSTESSNLA